MAAAAGLDRAHAAPPGPSLRVLELFSGIGGLQAALQQALPGVATNVTAIDTNTVANACHSALWRQAPGQPALGQEAPGPTSTVLTASLEYWATPAALDAAAPDVLLLSPPCQPYTGTVNGLQRDDADPRALGLLRLAASLGDVAAPPPCILLENVPGFGGSRSRAAWRAALAGRGYVCREVVACPTQLGIPCRRLRHYSLSWLPGGGDRTRAVAAAVQAALAASQQAVGGDGCSAGQGGGRGGVPRGAALQPWADALLCRQEEGEAASQPPLRPPQTQPMSSFLEACHWDGSAAAGGGLPCLDWEVVARHAQRLDVVTPSSPACNCFTKAYGSTTRHLGPSGSMLATEEAAARLCAGPDDRGRLLLDRGLLAAALEGGPGQAPAPLRLFTPGEVAELLGLPGPLAWPPGVTTAQRYALLGNSVSVHVVAALLWHLLGQAAAGAGGGSGTSTGSAGLAAGVPGGSM